VLGIARFPSNVTVPTTPSTGAATPTVRWNTAPCSLLPHAVGTHRTERSNSVQQERQSSIGEPGPSGMPSTHQATNSRIHAMEMAITYGIISATTVPMPAFLS